MSVFGNYEPAPSATAGGILSPLISLGIGIALFVFLNKFARSAKAGVDANDSYLINEGLGGLSTYFKIVGVPVSYTHLDVYKRQELDGGTCDKRSEVSQ